MEQYTFILTVSKELPRQCVRYGTPSAKYASRKNVGVRMPDDAICQEIMEKLDAPLISTRLVYSVFDFFFFFSFGCISVAGKDIFLILYFCY